MGYLKYLPLIFILSACSTTVERAEYSEIAAKNEALKTQWERIDAKIKADCEDGICELPERNIDALAEYINSLKQQIEDRVIAHNKLVDSLTQEEMAKHREREARQTCEVAMEREKILNTAKSALYLGICGLGLIR